MNVTNDRVIKTLNLFAIEYAKANVFSKEDIFSFMKRMYLDFKIPVTEVIVATGKILVCACQIGIDLETAYNLINNTHLQDELEKELK